MVYISWRSLWGIRRYEKDGGVSQRKKTWSAVLIVIALAHAKSSTISLSPDSRHVHNATGETCHRNNQVAQIPGT
jgi:hypothetical protein